MTTTIRLTVSDYRALPPTAPRMELLDGEFVMSPSPSVLHQRTVARLYFLLAAWLKDNPIGEVFIAPCDVYLSDSDAVQPDVFVVLHANRDRIKPDGIHGAPDLVIEVLSPKSGGQDLGKKRKIYGKSGVPEYWIADPASATVAQYRLQESEEPRTFGAGDRLSTAILPGFSPVVDEIFGS
ncbi:MAG: Uma2 family endonuclease [Planctomycetes bacterium]|nr:Uma2 family endonuclease [Planctomycetota bacterium]